MRRIVPTVLAIGLLNYSVGCSKESSSEVNDGYESTNKDGNDPLFDRHSNEGGELTAQIILGITDLGMAKWIYSSGKPRIDPKWALLQKMEEEALKDLEAAKATMTEAERNARLNRLKGAKEIYEARLARELEPDNLTYEANVRRSEFHSKINDLEMQLHKFTHDKLTAAVDDVARSARITAAEKALSEARANILNSDYVPQKVSSVIKFVRVAGYVIFITDVLGRVYVWNALDANPGFSPVLTVLTHYGKKVDFTMIGAAMSANPKAVASAEDFLNRFDSQQ